MIATISGSPDCAGAVTSRACRRHRAKPAAGSGAGAGKLAGECSAVLARPVNMRVLADAQKQIELLGRENRSPRAQAEGEMLR
jgi:hypothetical protein